MPEGSWILSHFVSAAHTPKVAATAMMIASHHLTGSTNHIRTSSSASVQGMKPIALEDHAVDEKQPDDHQHLAPARAGPERGQRRAAGDEGLADDARDSAHIRMPIQ